MRRQRGASGTIEEHAVRAALQHYFDDSATDEDVAHGIYREDAVLEVPQPGSGSRRRELP